MTNKLEQLKKEMEEAKAALDVHDDALNAYAAAYAAAFDAARIATHAAARDTYQTAHAAYNKELNKNNES